MQKRKETRRRVCEKGDLRACGSEKGLNLKRVALTFTCTSLLHFNSLLHISFIGGSILECTMQWVHFKSLKNFPFLRRTFCGRCEKGDWTSENFLRKMERVRVRVRVRD